jgi:dihydropteroate synthase
LRAYANLGGVEVGDGFPVRVVGVLNVSPESFYTGSVRRGRRQLQKEAERMLVEGADILDVGAMSTAPYRRAAIPAAEEERRLTTAIKALLEVAKVPISADTQRSKVAGGALRAGATILNDVRGLAGDGDMGRVARDADGLILMAYADRAGTGSPLGTIGRLLRGCVSRARAAGIPRRRIVLDPGIGFFRKATLPWHQVDCLILRELHRFRRVGQPLLIGASRKSFLGHIAGRDDPGERLPASLAAAAIAVVNGAAVIRTHDVQATVDAVRVGRAVRDASGRVMGRRTRSG